MDSKQNSGIVGCFNRPLQCVHPTRDVIYKRFLVVADVGCQTNPDQTGSVERDLVYLRVNLSWNPARPPAWNECIDFMESYWLRRARDLFELYSHPPLPSYVDTVFLNNWFPKVVTKWGAADAIRISIASVRCRDSFTQFPYVEPIVPFTSAPSRSSASTVVNKVKGVRTVASSCYFITLRLNTFYDTIREDIALSFVDFLQIVVSAELDRSTKTNVSLYHYHIFVRLQYREYFDQMREYIELVFNNPVYLDVRNCRSPKSVLKYITKSDRDAYVFGVKVSELSFYYQAFDWARSVDRFDTTHPFVAAHWVKYRYLERFFNEVHDVSRDGIPSFKRVDQSYYGWPLECATWWNGTLRPWFHKRKALYLEGPTSIGKSSYIEKLIGRKNLKYVYYPSGGLFFMQGYTHHHRIIIFEEFHMPNFHAFQLKRLLEGKPFAYPVKCGADLLITFKGPIIFISNENNIDDDALRARMFFVSAEQAFWELVTCVVPKDEVDAVPETEVVDVSSSSDLEEDPGPSGSRQTALPSNSRKRRTSSSSSDSSILDFAPPSKRRYRVLHASTSTTSW